MTGAKNCTLLPFTNSLIWGTPCFGQSQFYESYHHLEFSCQAGGGKLMKIVYKTNDLEHDLPTQEFRVNLDHTPEYPKTFISHHFSVLKDLKRVQQRPNIELLFELVDLICTPSYRDF